MAHLKWAQRLEDEGLSRLKLKSSDFESNYSSITATSQQQEAVTATSLQQEDVTTASSLQEGVAVSSPEVVSSSSSSVTTRVGIEKMPDDATADDVDLTSKYNCDDRRDVCDATSFQADAAYPSTYAISSWSSTSSVATR